MQTSRGGPRLTGGGYQPGNAAKRLSTVLFITHLGRKLRADILGCASLYKARPLECDTIESKKVSAGLPKAYNSMRGGIAGRNPIRTRPGKFLGCDAGRSKTEKRQDFLLLAHRIMVTQIYKFAAERFFK